MKWRSGSPPSSARNWSATARRANCTPSPLRNRVTSASMQASRVAVWKGAAQRAGVLGPLETMMRTRWAWVSGFKGLVHLDQRHAMARGW